MSHKLALNYFSLEAVPSGVLAPGGLCRVLQLVV